MHNLERIVESQFLIQIVILVAAGTPEIAAFCDVPLKQQTMWNVRFFLRDIVRLVAHSN